MKIFGILLTGLGLFLFLGCFLNKRRLRMQDEEGDTWLEERAEETSKKLGLPKNMVKVNQQFINLGFKIATICTLGGLSIIASSSIWTLAPAALNSRIPPLDSGGGFPFTSTLTYQGEHGST